VLGGDCVWAVVTCAKPEPLIESCCYAPTTYDHLRKDEMAVHLPSMT
jgi:hypothetical protein